jgi:membrane-bound serine protease (ClpP class)
VLRWRKITMVDFLFNPNIAYLLLVVSSLLALACILSPGTGILEMTTLVLFVVTGWVIYNSTINLWALIVLALGMVPFWMAVRRSGNRLHLLLAILAFIIGSTFLYTQPGSWLPAVNPLLGVGVSVVSSVFLWWATRRTLEVLHSVPAHDVGRLIGAAGEARTDIHVEGTVYVEGELWSATSRELIPDRSQVRVIGRNGLILEVVKVTDA